MMKFAMMLAALLGTVATAKPVRKDWAVLTQEEKDAFGRGCNILKENGSWDLIVHHHLYAFLYATPWNDRVCDPAVDSADCQSDEYPDTIRRNQESKGPAFLPFHRELVALMERKLQEALGDPDFGMPYWNYVNDAEGINPDPKSNPMWGPNDIGSDGRAEDGVVVDGPFAYWPIKWSADRPFNDPRPREVFLERTLGQVAEFPSLAGDLEDSWNQTAYDGDDLDASSSVGIRNWLAGSYSSRGALSLFNPDLPLCSLHCQAHGFIGASMLIGSSPNDPVFFLLHSFTDGTWYQWQKAQVEANPGTTYDDYYFPYSGGPIGHNIDDSMNQLEVTPRSVLNIDELNYVYEGLPEPMLR
jgi:tyrosinase